MAGWDKDGTLKYGAEIVQRNRRGKNLGMYGLARNVMADPKVFLGVKNICSGGVWRER